MIHPSFIQPDAELRDFLQGKIKVGQSILKVFSDWERPTNGLPSDFLVIYVNGDIQGLGSDVPFAKGYLMVSLYCKLNDNGSVKSNRVQNILKQFDTLIEGATTENYHYEYDMQRFITPTTPNQTAGYSISTLNLRWTTTKSFNS